MFLFKNEKIQLEYLIIIIIIIIIIITCLGVSSSSGSVLCVMCYVVRMTLVCCV